MSKPIQAMIDAKTEAEVTTAMTASTATTSSIASAVSANTIADSTLYTALSMTPVFEYGSYSDSDIEIVQKALGNNKNMHTLRVEGSYETSRLYQILNTVALSGQCTLSTLEFIGCHFYDYYGERRGGMQAPTYLPHWKSSTTNKESAEARESINDPITALQKIFAAHKISQLTLRECKIQDAQLATIIKALNKQHIKELDLNKVSSMGPKSCAALTAFLTDNNVIRALKINHCGLENKYASYVDPLQDETLAVLIGTFLDKKIPVIRELSVSDVGPKTIQKISALLEISTTLKSISLWLGTPETDAPNAMTSLCHSLTKNKKTILSNLDIGVNLALDSACTITALQSLLKENTTLETISMMMYSYGSYREFEMSGDDLTSFYSAIQENVGTRIRTLSLPPVSDKVEPPEDDAKPSEERGTAVSKLFGSNTTLTHLDIARFGQAFPSDHLSNIMTAVRSNTHSAVTAISFCGYPIGDGILLLAEWLRNPGCKIARLSFGEESASFKTSNVLWNTVLTALETNTSLTSLDVSFVRMDDNTYTSRTACHDIFFHLLKNRNLNLTELVLTHYHVPTSDGFQYLRSFLSTNQTLKKLKLTDSAYGWDQIALCETIKNNQKLHLLELQVNLQFGSERENTVAQSTLLRAKPSLTTLDRMDIYSEKRYNNILNPLLQRNRAISSRLNYFWSFLAPLMAFHRANNTSAFRDSIDSLLNSAEQERASIAELAELPPLQGLNQSRIKSAVELKYFEHVTGTKNAKMPKLTASEALTASTTTVQNKKYTPIFF